jgi:aminoglycoside N3'-acetyltransferase
VVTEQLTFDVQPLIHPEARGLTIQQRFELFHAANPWVYSALESVVADLINRGQRKVGIRMAWEVVRWTYARRTTDPTSSFRANDHYHSRYVRLLIDRHPEWADVFELRELRAS